MKKAFTLIEIIVIVGILAILLWTSSFLRNRNEDEKIKYWKECSNYIFQEVLNQDNNIKKNKTINSWDEILLITWIQIKKENKDSYLVSMNTFNEKSELNSQNTLINNKWSCTADHISNKNNYIINTDDDFMIRIQKNNNFAYKTTISVCDFGWNNCIEISKIEYNQASNKFDLKSCSLINNEWLCEEWKK
jgi:hypothetical protein